MSPTIPHSDSIEDMKLMRLDEIEVSQTVFIIVKFDSIVVSLYEVENGKEKHHESSETI